VDLKDIGSNDLEFAISLMQDSPGWTGNIFKHPNPASVETSGINEQIASLHVRMVLLARWIIFRTFIEVAGEEISGELPANIKWDWVLFQARSVDFNRGQDPFRSLISLCFLKMTPHDISVWLQRLACPDFLGSDFNEDFFMLSTKLMSSFSSQDGTVERPVLCPIIRCITLSTDIRPRVIVSGTGFEHFKTILASGVGKPSAWDVLHTTGYFTDKEVQKDYIVRYLPPSYLRSQSGISLLSRLFHWLHGR
jgi:hypothetical protein